MVLYVSGTNSLSIWNTVARCVRICFSEVWVDRKKKENESDSHTVRCPAIVRHFLLFYCHQDKTQKRPCSLSRFQLFSSFMRPTTAAHLSSR